MAFRHRKLLNESVTMDTVCESLCKAPTNTHRLCPPPCAVFCPPDCTPFQFGLPLSPPPPPPSPPVFVHRIHALSLGLTISLSVLATAFFLFICYTIYRFCSYWRNSSRRRRPEEDGGPNDFIDEEHGPIVDHPIWYIRTIGLQPSVINAITVVKYKRGDGLIEGTDCAVCLNEFEEDETLRLLPKCNHAFHIPCVDTWLRSHTNCPMCRAGIVNDAAAPLPSQELVVQNSSPIEENQLEISGESGRDLETEPSELRAGARVEDDGISRSQSGLKFNGDAGVLDGIQPMRRSVSMDSSSASMISAAIASAFPRQSNSNSDNQLDEAKESTVEDIAGLNQSFQRLGSPSIERCTMKRSVSCSESIGFKA